MRFLRLSILTLALAAAFTFNFAIDGADARVGRSAIVWSWEPADWQLALC